MRLRKKILKAIQYALPLFLGFYVYLIKRNRPEDPIWRALFDLAKAKDLAIYITFIVAQLAAKITDDYLENHPKDLRKKILENLHRHQFRDKADSAVNYRVTLFKHTRWFFWQWLCIDSRSGKLYDRSKISFRIDDNDETKNQGIAGLIWLKQNFISKSNLPDWQENDRERSRTYASESLLPLDKARRLKIKCRSICGSVVKDSGGKLWGVLIIDSRLPDGIDHLKASDLMPHLEMLGTILN